MLDEHVEGEAEADGRKLRGIADEDQGRISDASHHLPEQRKIDHGGLVDDEDVARMQARPRVTGGFLEEAGDGHRGSAGRLGHALRRAAGERDEHGVAPEAFGEFADPTQRRCLARAGITAKQREAMPERERDGGPSAGR